VFLAVKRVIRCNACSNPKNGAVRWWLEIKRTTTKLEDEEDQIAIDRINCLLNNSFETRAWKKLCLSRLNYKEERLWDVMSFVVPIGSIMIWQKMAVGKNMY
jgi:hypothetical protein